MDGGISRRATDKLNERRIKAFLAQAKPGAKISDGGGMFLTLTPAGTPCWRIKYRYPDAERGMVERLYSVGTYPDIGLAAARSERDGLKERLREGRDPVKVRQLNKAMAVTSSGNTFELVARDWLEEQKTDWSKIHYDKSSQALERDVMPVIGKLPVADVTPAVMTGVIKRIERRAPDTARKILQHVHGIFQLAQARDLRTDNPCAPVAVALKKRRRVKHRPAILEWPGLGDVLRNAEAAHLSPAVRLAHRLCAFSVARISNIVQAEWPEFHLDADIPMWVIPRKKMKAQDRDHDHKIILGPTIATDLRNWRNLIGGKGYVFPSPQGGKHITRESLEKAYRVTLKLNDKHTPHGWRSAFSTLAKDTPKDKGGGFERDVVELALDHIHDTDVVRAYDRGERLQERERLMNWWDGQLMQAQRGADVVPMLRAKK